MKPLILSLICLAAFSVNSANANEYTKLIKTYKYAEAEKAVNGKLASDPKNLDALVGKIELILSQGGEARLEEGIKLAEQCVAAHPQASECHEMMGNLYGAKIVNGGLFSAMSSSGKVRDAFLKAVELNPKNYSTRSSLLVFYLNAPGIAGGGKDKALAMVADTAKLSKEAAALLQARVDAKDDKMAQAESAVLGTNTANNEELEDLQIIALSAVGIAYREQKKLADSERVLQEFVKRFPGNAPSHALLGRTLALQNRHNEAISQFEKALALDNRASFHYRLAQSNLAVGDKAKAIANFEKALALKNGLDKKLKEDAETQLKAIKA
jgi:tetratricopeptide (TPR) repeat protein